MDQGLVAELGHHTALVAKGGIYANLVRRQLDGMSSLDDVPSAAKETPSGGQAGRGKGRRGGRGGRGL